MFTLVKKTEIYEFSNFGKNLIKFSINSYQNIINNPRLITEFRGKISYLGKSNEITTLTDKFALLTSFSSRVSCFPFWYFLLARLLHSNTTISRAFIIFIIFFLFFLYTTHRFIYIKKSPLATWNWRPVVETHLVTTVLKALLSLLLQSPIIVFFLFLSRLLSTREKIGIIPPFTSKQS